MGYCIGQSGGVFGIPARHVESALEAVCNANPCYPRQHTIQSIQDEIEDYQFLPAISKLKKIILKGWGFKLNTDEDGDVVGVQWEWEKLQSETDNWMKAVAPFVPAGCFIEMVGEDGDKWRYMFDGLTVKEVHPKLVWE